MSGENVKSTLYFSPYGYDCEKCGKKFDSIVSRKLHSLDCLSVQNIAGLKRDLDCPVHNCETKFYTNERLALHLSEEHPSYCSIARHDYGLREVYFNRRSDFAEWFSTICDKFRYKFSIAPCPIPGVEIFKCADGPVRKGKRTCAAFVKVKAEENGHFTCTFSFIHVFHKFRAIPFIQVPKGNFCFVIKNKKQLPDYSTPATPDSNVDEHSEDSDGDVIFLSRIHKDTSIHREMRQKPEIQLENLWEMTTNNSIAPAVQPADHQYERLVRPTYLVLPQKPALASAQQNNLFTNSVNQDLPPKENSSHNRHSNRILKGSSIQSSREVSQVDGLTENVSTDLPTKTGASVMETRSARAENEKRNNASKSNVFERVTQILKDHTRALTQNEQAETVEEEINDGRDDRDDDEEYSPSELIKPASDSSTGNKRYPLRYPRINALPRSNTYVPAKKVKLTPVSAKSTDRLNNTNSRESSREILSPKIAKPALFLSNSTTPTSMHIEDAEAEAKCQTVLKIANMEMKHLKDPNAFLSGFTAETPAADDCSLKYSVMRNFHRIKEAAVILEMFSDSDVPCDNQTATVLRDTQELMWKIILKLGNSKADVIGEKRKQSSTNSSAKTTKSQRLAKSQTK